MQIAWLSSVKATAHVRRIQRRGVTVVEAGLVAALVAMVAGGAVLLLGPSSATTARDQALGDAALIGEAARAWQREHASGCPTLTELQRARQLGQDARTEDPWGGRFRVICVSDAVTVSSPGPDTKSQTKDDIRWRGD
jgi:type II secretory pathway pseudopilin PulG